MVQRRVVAREELDLGLDAIGGGLGGRDLLERQCRRYAQSSRDTDLDRVSLPKKLQSIHIHTLSRQFLLDDPPRSRHHRFTDEHRIAGVRNRFRHPVAQPVDKIFSHLGITPCN